MHPITKTADFDFNLLNGELKLSKEETPYFEKFYKAFNGDFWQEGVTVLLPAPSPASKSVLDKLFEERYVSRNILQEVVERVSSAFLGKAPNWNYVVDGKQINLVEVDLKKKRIARKEKSIADLQAMQLKSTQDGGGVTVPQAPLPTVSDEEKISPEDEKLSKELSEINKALGEFWTTEGLAELMIKAFENRLVSSRGGLRIYVPGKYRTETGQVKSAKTIAEALKMIKVEAVDPMKSRLLKDEGELFSIVCYEKRKDWASKEATKCIEFSFVDDAGKTFVAVWEENGTDKGLPKTPGSSLSQGLSLDENTTFYEIQGKPYINEQIFKQNQLANLSLTCGGFNIVDNGFGEMVLTNVDLEMEEVDDPGSDTGKKLIPKKIKRGGGAINNFVGVSKINMQTGQEEVTTPGVHFREPSSMQTFKDGYYLAYAAALEEAGQKYALIAGDATASGEARIQAMADFYLKVKKYKPDVDKLGSWLMTVVLRLAAVLSSQSGLDNTSILFDSRVRIGNLTSSERDSVMKMRKDGLISFETARVLLDIDDPELEKELIEAEESEKSVADTVAARRQTVETIAQFNSAEAVPGGSSGSSPQDQ